MTSTSRSLKPSSPLNKENGGGGVIAAGDPATAKAGADILRQGGNAVDAAVAAAFVSFIAEIGVVHLGGSGIAHIYDPASDESVVYDFFSAMPGLGRAQPANQLDFQKVTVNYGPTTQEFYLGRGSVAVPGNIIGLCQMAADHGRLPLAQLLEPAIQLARTGHPLAPFQADTCALLHPIYTHTEEMRAIFTRQTSPTEPARIVRAGERLFIPHLAETLQELARVGPDLARRGRLAQALLADQATYGGLLTRQDLESYQALRLPAIRLPYRQYELRLPPPSSTGGVLTAFSLKLLAHFDVGQWSHGSSRHLALLYLVMEATGQARDRWEDWQERLPAQEAIAAFLDDAFMSPYLSAIKAALQEGRPLSTTPEAPGGANTSHLSVVDQDGLAVGLTTTAGESAGYLPPGTGFIANNILGEADLHPRGFHTRPAGQRIPTMMTPTIVLRQGKVRLVVGSGGSIRIRSAILQVLSNFLDFGMSLEEAVNAPRVHLENGVLQCEAGYNESAVAALEGMGYPVNRWDKRSIYFGGAHSVAQMDDGRLAAAGDNRRGGATNCQ